MFFVIIIYNLYERNLMKYFLSLFVSIIFIACGTNSSDDKEVKLLFKSGFEDGVYLDTPYNDGGATWMQDIKGSDNSNFSFPINIWETKGSFQVLVDSSVDSYEYIQNKIITTIGHTGEYTKVMSSEVLKADKSWTQDPYILEDAKEDGDLYISYWLKLPANLPAVLGDGTNDDGWCTFFEFKTSGDYRIAAYVYVEDDQVFWHAHGDNVANGDNFTVRKEYWQRDNKIVPVPQDEWFKVEFFWHRSTNSDGRFWWAVNGNVIVDYHGVNKIKEPIDRIMLFTVYSEKLPLKQLVDDIEIYDGFPCGEGKSCYEK